MSQCIYQTVIVDKGVNVDAFGGEMMILFGSGAPDTLKDFCYSIEVHEPEATIEAGQDLIIDGEAFRIQSVGEIAQRNLKELGHLTVNFTGTQEEPLPGAMVVEQKAKPAMDIGTVITIMA